jgi:hypothetical protein
MTESDQQGVLESRAKVTGSVLGSRAKVTESVLG